MMSLQSKTVCVFGGVVPVFVEGLQLKTNTAHPGSIKVGNGYVHLRDEDRIGTSSSGYLSGKEELVFNNRGGGHDGKNWGVGAYWKDRTDTYGFKVNCEKQEEDIIASLQGRDNVEDALLNYHSDDSLASEWVQTEYDRSLNDDRSNLIRETKTQGFAIWITDVKEEMDGYTFTYNLRTNIQDAEHVDVESDQLTYVVEGCKLVKDDVGDYSIAFDQSTSSFCTSVGDQTLSDEYKVNVDGRVDTYRFFVDFRIAGPQIVANLEHHKNPDLSGSTEEALAMFGNIGGEGDNSNTEWISDVEKHENGEDYTFTYNMRKPISDHTAAENVESDHLTYVIEDCRLVGDRVVFGNSPYFTTSEEVCPSYELVEEVESDGGFYKSDVGKNVVPIFIISMVLLFLFYKLILCLCLKKKA